MYDNYLRHLKDWIGTPLCRILPSGITPNHITLAAFISGLLAVGIAALPTSQPSHWPLIFWLLNRLLDGADGTLARMRGSATPLGGFLDLLGDFTIYSLIPPMLAYGQERRLADPADPVSSMNVDWRAVAMLEATFHINNFVLFYISAVVSAKPDSELTNVSMRPALIEGLESGLIFTAMFIWPQYVTLLCWGMSVAVIIGIAQRVNFIIPSLKRLDQRPGNQKMSISTDGSQ